MSNNGKKEQPEVKSEFTNPHHLAKVLGLSYRTVHRAIKEGKVKCVRVGRQYRVPMAEMERIMVSGF
jgi:excisionase family DNA binding protein